MSLKDELTARLGDRMRASMGAGSTREPDAAPPVPPGTTVHAPAKHEGLKAYRAAAMIPIDRLTADPDQPRKTFPDEEIDRMADSLRARGMLQPIRARWDAELARWVIVAGERRFRAARRAGWTEVPCVTVDAPLTRSDILVDQLIENCLREDLSPLEQAGAFKALMDANTWSARRLAEELHISHQTVIRALGLLKLPDDVRERVERGELSPRAAAEIATLEQPEDQRTIAGLAVSGGLNRDQIVDAVKATKAGRPAPAKPSRHTTKLEDGTRVIVEGAAAAAGEPAIAEALARARKRILSTIRAANHGEAA
jgi:ParB family transcriptional regulator, chromosome partitioning protein